MDRDLLRPIRQLGFFDQQALERYWQERIRDEAIHCRSVAAVNAARDGERISITATVDAETSVPGTGGAVFEVAVFRVEHAGGRQLIEHQRAVDFRLRDVAGDTVFVDVDHGQLIARAPTMTLGDRSQLPGWREVRGYEAELEILRQPDSVQRVRCGRVAVRAGDTALVCGVIKRIIDQSVAERSYRETPTRMALTASEKFPLTVMRPL